MPSDDDIVDEISRWGEREPSPDALPFLHSAGTLAVVRAPYGVDDDRFEALSTLHRTAVDRQLSPVLLGIAEGRPVSAATLDALVTVTGQDPVGSAFAATSDSPSEQTLQRLSLLPDLWGPFADWWHGYFSDEAARRPPITDLWRLYLPFGQWIVREKRASRPDELFVVGVNGSPGAGKTVLTNALAVVLNRLLDSAAEGSALAVSGDDWYLGKSERAPLRQRGYDPGRPGVSNRGLPGTHDLDRLTRNLGELERSSQHSVIRMGRFDKKEDDQRTGAERYVEVRGKVGVLLFDLWFAGARTDIDPTELPDGLRRRVAERLREWQPVFDRMDALCGFDWPSIEHIVREREAQERLVERLRGARGMSEQDVRTFIGYLVDKAWDWQITSPVPPADAVTFRCWHDTSHRVIAVERGQAR